MGRLDWRAVRRYLPLLILVAVQQGFLWMVFLSQNPEATVTWDCVAGAMGYDALRGWSFSPIDSFDGVLGGMFVASLVGLPMFAVLGVTGLTVKATSALLIAALTIITWLTWTRFSGGLHGVLAAVAVILVPPLVFISSLMMGQWHFTELIFEGLAALVLFRLVFSGRPDQPLPVSGLLGLGLVLGLALFNCFASLVFFPAFLGLLWAAGKNRLGPLHGAALVGGLLAASSPGWWKLLGHRPYGIEQAARASIPPQARHSPFHLSELFDMIPGGGFAGAMHFDTAFGGEALGGLAWALSVAVTVGLFVGWLGMLVRVSPSIVRTVRSLIPRMPCASPGRLSPAALPPVMAGLYGLAYLLSELRLEHLDWWLSNPRDHGHTALVPWVVWMAISGALLLGSLVSEWRGDGCPEGERSTPGWMPRAGVVAVAAVLVASVQLPSVVGIAAMRAEVAPQARASEFYRGHCWDVFGFYMAPHLQLDPDQISEGCDRYGEVGRVECYRGGAWAMGFLMTSGQIDAAVRGGVSPLSGADGGGAALCLDRPALWRAECLRGVGWALSSGGAGDVSADESIAHECDQLSSADDRRACWLGVGFPIGDHLNSTPPRLRRRLLDFPEDRRQWVVEGAGGQVGRSYGSRAAMARVCATWGVEYEESCMRGAEHSLWFRASSVAP